MVDVIFNTQVINVTHKPHGDHMETNGPHKINLVNIQQNAFLGSVKTNLKVIIIICVKHSSERFSFVEVGVTFAKMLLEAVSKLTVFPSGFQILLALLFLHYLLHLN